MVVIDNEIIDLLQYRIQQEELSKRLYLSMSIWLDYNGYTGASKLWKKYSCEEQEHADWVYKYLLDLDVKPKVSRLSEPQKEFKDLPNIIALSYQHELDIYTQCVNLAKKCTENNDYMTLNLAQKFLYEQRDEIAKTKMWLDKLEAFGVDKTALRLLDNEMDELSK